MVLSYLSGQRMQGESFSAGGTFDGKSENDQTDTFNDDIRGAQIQAGHTLIGKVITSITLKAQKGSGASSGTYKLGLFNATGVLQHQFKTASISTLASSYTEVTGNDLGSGDTTADRTVGTNYIIGMTNSGGNTHRVQLRQSTSVGRANEITGKCASAGSSFVAGGENADLYMEVIYAEYGDEKPTNVPIGTRFEETDTRKIYRYAQDAVSGTDLKAYYKFDEASGNIVNVANTITGNSTLGTGQNITMNGDPTYSVTGTPSSFGNAVSCDGSGDYGQFGTKTDWNFLHSTGTTWTINVWLKFDATVAGNKQLIDNNRTADSTIGLNIRTQTDNKFRVIMARGVGNSSTLDTDNNPNLPIPTDNAWHMYTFRWDQSSGNGVLTYNTDASNEVTANGSGNGTTTSDCTDSLRLFSVSNSVSGELDAEIVEMSIYNTVLTDAQVTTLYNSGSGVQLDIGAKVWKEKGSA